MSQPTTAEHRCTRCNGRAEFSAKEGVWRHAGEPHQREFLEQNFCDRYGYPIEVTTTAEHTEETRC